MSPSNIISSLEFIDKPINTDSREKYNLHCINKMLFLLSIEQEILENISMEIVPPLQRALSRSIPMTTFVGTGAAGIPVPEVQAEEILQVSTLLTSPLIEALDSDLMAVFQNGIIYLLHRVIVTYTHNPNLPIPPNASILGEILSVPDLKLSLFPYGMYYIPILTWALKGNNTLLSHFTTSELMLVSDVEDTPLDTHLSVLDQVLNDKGIDKDLFWNMVKEIPDIPIITLFDLLENNHNTTVCH